MQGKYGDPFKTVLILLTFRRPHHMYYRFDPPSTHSKGLVLVDHGKDLRQAIDKAAEVFIQSDLKLRTSQLKLAAGKLQVRNNPSLIPNIDTMFMSIDRCHRLCCSKSEFTQSWRKRRHEF